MNLFENLQTLNEDNSVLKVMDEYDLYAYSHGQLDNIVNQFKDGSMPLYAHDGDNNENEIIVCGANDDIHEAIVNVLYYTTFDDKEHRAMKYYDKKDKAIRDAESLIEIIYKDLDEDDEEELKANEFKITILDY